MYALRGEAVGIEGEAAVPSLDSGNRKLTGGIWIEAGGGVAWWLGRRRD